MLTARLYKSYARKKKAKHADRPREATLVGPGWVRSGRPDGWLGGTRGQKTSKARAVTGDSFGAGGSVDQAAGPYTYMMYNALGGGGGVRE